MKLRKSHRATLSLSTLLVAAVLMPSQANGTPDGAKVVAGSASVTGQGTANVVVNQASERAFVEWDSFSLRPGETVRFNQPGVSAITANKVVGLSPSEIFGAISANGRVILINPNGIVFGKESTVDAAGLIATTLDLGRDEFMRGGQLRFLAAEDSAAAVVNEGDISVGGAGLAAFVAPHVRNRGVIVAKLGTIALASGRAFTVDFYGDGLLSFGLDAGLLSSTAGQVAADSKAQVEHAGVLDATRVVLSSAAAREVVNRSVNIGGLVRAGSVAVAADGVVTLGGAIDVSSASAEGGSVDVHAREIHMAASAAIDASGATKGGQVMLWADPKLSYTRTVVAGSIDVTGAQGGFAETSGASLDVTGVRLAAGPGGLWLLDPIDVTIDAAQASSIASTLAGGAAVTVQADNNITVANAISAGGSAALTLDAGNGITLSAGITRGGAGSVDLLAGTGGVSGAGALALNGGRLTIRQGGDSTYSGDTSGAAASLVKQGAGNLSMAGRGDHTGLTTVSAGTLTLVPGASESTSRIRWASGTIQVNAGATAVIQASAGDGSNNLFNETNRTLTFTGAGTVRKTGSKTLQMGWSERVIAISLSAGGLFSLDSGGIAHNYVKGNWNANQGGLHVAAGATFDAYAEQVPITALSGAGNITNGFSAISELTLTSPTDHAFSGVLSGALSLVKGGAGKLSLSGNNTYTGSTKLNAGTLEFSGTNLMQMSGGGLALAANTTLIVSAGTTRFAYGNASFTTTGAVLDVAAGASLVLQTAMANNGVASKLTKTGAGRLFLNYNNTYSGGTDVLGGVVYVGDGSASGTAGSGNVALSAGTELIYWRSGVSTQANGISGSGQVTFLGNDTQNSFDYELNGDTSAFTGSVTIDRARLKRASSIGQPGSLSPITILTGGGFFNFQNVTIANNFTIAGDGWNEPSGRLGALRMQSGTLSGDISLSASAAIGSWGGAGAYTGSISGSGTLTIKGGASTLSGAGSYTGATAIFSGSTLKLSGANNVIPDQSAVSVGDSTSVLDLNGKSETFGSLSGDGELKMGGATLTFGNDGQSATFTGWLRGTGGNLVKVGAGTQTLSDNNNYSGSTLISAGRLKLTGGTQNTTGYNVASGATFELNATSVGTFGTGTWGQNVTYQGAGTVEITGTGAILGVDRALVGGGSTWRMSPGGLLKVAAGAYLRLDWGLVGNWDNNQGDLQVDGTFDLWDAGTSGYASSSVRFDKVSGTGTIYNDINLGSTGTLRVGVAGGSSVFGGTFRTWGNSGMAILKQGAGTFRVTGAATVNRGVTVEGGVVDLAGNSTISGVHVASVGTFKVSGATTTVDANSTTNTGAVFEVTSAGTLNFTSPVTGALAGSQLDKTGQGSLTFSVANTYTGVTNLREGTLVLSGAGNANNSDILLTGEANLRFVATDSRSFTKAITGSTTGVVSFAVAGDLSDTGNGSATYFTMANTGTFVAGSVRIDGGLVGPSVSTAFGATANVVQITGGGLASPNNLTLANDIEFSGAGDKVIRSWGSSRLTLTGRLRGTGTGTIKLTDFGETIFANPLNDFTSPLAIVGGADLWLGASGVIPDSVAVSMSNAATYFNLNGFDERIGSLSGSGEVVLGSNILYVGANNAITTWSGLMRGTDSGKFIKEGVGVLTLNTQRQLFTGTYRAAGGTTVLGYSSDGYGTLSSHLEVGPGATVQVGVDNALGWRRVEGGQVRSLTIDNGIFDALSRSDLHIWGGIPVTMTGGEFRLSNQVMLSGNTFSILPSSTASKIISNNASAGLGIRTEARGGAENALGWTTNDVTFDVRDGATLQLEVRFMPSNASSQTDSVVKFIGAGLARLSKDSSAVTSMTVQGVTLENSGTLWDSTNLTVGVGGVYKQLNALGDTIGSLAGSGGVVLGGDLLAGGTNLTTTYSGVMSGTGTFTKQGSGTLTLSGANSFIGGVTVSRGTLISGAAGVIPDASAVTVNAATTWNLAGYSETVGSLAGAGSVMLGSATLNAGGNHASTVYSGSMSGVGRLVKPGAGTFRLSGLNTFTGGVELAGGVLELGASSLANAATNTLIVRSGATATAFASDIWGTQANTIVSPVVVEAGAALTNSGDFYSQLGALTLAGTLTSVGGSQSAWALSGDVAIPAGASAVISGGGRIAVGSRGVTAIAFNLGAGADLLVSTPLRNGSTSSWFTEQASTASFNGGTVRLAAANTYSGATNVGAGVVFRVTGTLSDLTDVSLGSGSAYHVGVADEIGSLGGAGIVELSGNLTAGGSNATTTLTGAISETGAGGFVLNKTGAGVMTLTGANTYTGGTILTGGTLSLGSLGAVGTTGTLSFVGGTLQFSAANTTDYSPRFSNAANQRYSVDTNSQEITFSSALTSVGGTLTKMGLGGLTLDADNTFSSGLTQTGSGNYPGQGGGPWTGTIGYGTAYGSGVDTVAYITDQVLYEQQYGDSFTFRVNSTSNTGFSVSTYRIDTVDSYGTGWGSGGVFYWGASPVALTIKQGSLRLPRQSSLAQNVGIRVNSGGLLDVMGNSFSGIVRLDGGTLTNSRAAPATFSGQLVLTGPGSVGGDAGNLTITSFINNPYDSSETIRLRKVGSNTVILQGDNKVGSRASSFTGLTEIAAGVLQLDTQNALSVYSSNWSRGSVLFSGGMLRHTAGNTVDYSDKFRNGANAPYMVDTNGQSITWGSALTSPGGTLTKTGLGTLYLNADNSFTGGSSIQQGLVQVGTGGSTGKIGTGVADISAGAELRYFGGPTVVANGVSGAGLLKFTGNDTQNYFGYDFTSAVTTAFTGSVTIDQARLHRNSTIGSGSSLPVITVLDRGAFYISAGTVANDFNIRGFGWNETAGRLGAIRADGGAVSGAITMADAASLSAYGSAGTFSGVISGAGTLTVMGGDVTFSGANIYAGTTQLTGSGDSPILILTGSNNVIPDASRVEMANGTVLRLQKSETIGSLADFGGGLGGAVELNANTLTVGGNGATTSYSGLISGAGALVKNGAGTWNVLGDGGTDPGAGSYHTFTGGLTVNAGTVSLGYNDRSRRILANALTNTLTINGGATVIARGSDTWGNHAAGVVAPVVIDGGTLTTGLGYNFITTGRVTFRSNGLLTSNSQTTGFATWSIRGGIRVEGNGAITGTMPVAVGDPTADTVTISIPTGSVLTVDVPVTNRAGASYPNQANTNFDLVGGGLMVLNAANTYTGNTTITDGTLRLNGTLADTTNVTVQALGIYDVRASDTINSLAGSTGASVALAAGATLNTGYAGASSTFAGVISGAGNFVKSGGGVLTLSGSNTYTGYTHVAAGTIQIGADEVIPDLSAVTVASGAILDLTNKTETVGSIAGGDRVGGSTAGGTIRLGTGYLAAGGDGTSTIFAGVIEGTTQARFLKLGAGTLWLQGTNTYTGGTTVGTSALDGGTLKLGRARTVPVLAAADTNVLTVNRGTVELGVSDIWGVHNVDVRAPIVINQGGTVTTAPLGYDGNEIFITLGQVTLNGGTLTSANAGIYKAGNVNSPHRAVYALRRGLNVTGAGSVVSGVGQVMLGAPTSGGSAITRPAISVSAGADVVIGAVLRDNDFWDDLSTGFEKTGPGRLTLTGTNSYRGDSMVTGGTLRLGNDTNTGDLGVAAPTVALGATLEFYRSDLFTFSKVISGAGGIRKIGAGMTVLAVANTFSGLTDVAEGVLQVDNGGTVASLGAGDVSISSGATLRYYRSDVGGAGTDHLIASTISGGGTLAFYGTGVSGRSSYEIRGNLAAFAGNITVERARLMLSAGSTQPASTPIAVLGGGGLWATTDIAHPLSLSGQGWLESSGRLGALRLADGVVASGAITLATDARITVYGASGQRARVAGIISGPGGLEAWSLASSTLVLTGSHAYTGPTTVRQGALQLGNGTFAGSVTTSSGIDVSAGSVLRMNSPSDVTYGIIFSGAGELDQMGPGVLTLAGTNTYTGATSVSAGILQLGDGGATGSVSASSGIDVAAGATLRFNRSDDLSFGGTIFTGAGDLHQAGSGDLAIGGIQVFTGRTKVTAGSLTLGFDGSLGLTPISFDATALTLDGGILRTSANFSLNANRGLFLGASGGSVLVSGGTSSVLSVISGTGSLTKIGAGTLEVSGANIFAGVTTVASGVLRVTHGQGLGTVTGGTLVGAGATLDLHGVAVGAETVTLAGGTLSDLTSSLAGQVVLTADSTIAIPNAGDMLVLSGGITGAYAITKTGAGTLRLATTASDYSGATLVTDGRLELLATLADSTDVTASAGATVVFGVADVVRDISGAGTFVLDDAVTAGSFADVAVSGPVTGAGSLRKIGGGALTLSGPNSFSGGLRVSSGKVVAGSGSAFGTSEVTILDGSTVDLAGHSAANRFVVAGAGLAGAGALVASTGSSAVSGDVTFSAASVLGGAGELSLSGVTSSGSNLLTLVGAGAKNLTNQANDIRLVAASGIGSLNLLTATDLSFGALAGFQGIMATGAVSIASTGRLTLGSGDVVRSANGSIGLAAGRFTNAAGASALIPGSGGNWTVWSSNPQPFSGATPDIRGGIDFDYKAYGVNGSGIVAGSLNGLRYLYAPKLTVTLTGAPTKVYDRTLDLPLSALGSVAYSFAGLVDGDASATVGAPISAAFLDRNVGGAKTIEVAGLTVTGATSSLLTGSKPVTGYLVDYLPSSDLVRGDIGTITPRPLAAAFAVSTKQYDRTTAATVVGSSVDVIGGDNVVVAAQNASFLTHDAGVAKSVNVSGITLSGQDAGNYQLSSSAVTVFGDITPASLGLVGASVTRVYDSTNELGVVGGYGPLAGMVFAGDSVAVSGQAVFDSSVAGPRAVHQGSVSLVGPQAGNYRIVWTDGVGLINKAPLVVRPKDAADLVTRARNSVFDGVQVSGLVGADSLSSLDLSGLTIARNGGANPPAGAYALTASGLLSQTNYEVSYSPGLYTVIPAGTLLVRAANTSVVYGDTPALAVSSAEYLDSGLQFYSLVNTGGSLWSDGSGGIADISLVVQGAGTTGAGRLAAGVHPIAAAVIQQGGNWNSFATTGNLTVTPRPLTASLQSAPTKVYDRTTTMAALPVFQFGSLAGDQVTLAGYGSFAGYAASNSVGYAVSGLTLSGADAANYYVANSGGQIVGTDGVITRRAASLSGVTAVDKLYDGTRDAALDYAGAVFAGILPGDSLRVSSAAGIFVDAQFGAGKRVDVTTLALVGDEANYAVTLPTLLSASIARRSLIVSGLSVIAKEYDRSLTANVSTAGVMFGGDGLAAADVSQVSVVSTGLFADRNVGSGKSVALTNVYQGLGANYVLVDQVSAVGDILPKVVQLSGVAVADRAYDGTTHATVLGAGVQYGNGGFFAGEDVSAVVSGVFQSRDAGTNIPVTLSTNLSGADAVNYRLVPQMIAAATITPKAVTVAAPAVTKVYDGGVAYALSGAEIAALSAQLGVAGDTVTSAAVAYADKNAATGKVVTLSSLAIADGNGGANYQVSFASSSSGVITPLASVSWIGGASGNWFDPLNWQGGLVPDLSNITTVQIPVGVTSITFDSRQAVGLTETGPVQVAFNGSPSALSVAAGTLAVGGPLVLDSFTQTGGDFSTQGDFRVASFTQTAGNLNITAGGDLTVTDAFAQSAVGTVVVGGSVSLNANATPLVTGNISAVGDLALTSGGGSITQLGGTALVAYGTTSANALLGGLSADIVLANVGNDLRGSITASGRDITLSSALNLTALINATGGATLTSGGNLSVSGNAQDLTTSSGGTTTLGPTSLTGGLTVTSVGDVTQTGPLTVSGPTSLTSTGGDITLTGSGNTFGGLLTATGNDISVTSLGDLTTLISATGGATLTSGGNLSVAGAASTVVTSSSGNTNLGNLSVSGNLSITANGSVQIASGATIIVNGAATLVSPRSTLNLTGGTISVTTIAEQPSRNELPYFLLNATRLAGVLLTPVSPAPVNQAVNNETASRTVAAAEDTVVFFESFRYVVPETYAVFDQEVALPDPSGQGAVTLGGGALRYHTAEPEVQGFARFRYLYPRVNLGEAYYVGTGTIRPSSDSAGSQGKVTKPPGPN